MKHDEKLLIIGLILLGMSSCVAVKEYEKVYINDPDMKLAATQQERFEINFQVYREAAPGPTVVKQVEVVDVIKKQ